MSRATVQVREWIRYWRLWFRLWRLGRHLSQLHNEAFVIRMRIEALEYLIETYSTDIGKVRDHCTVCQEEGA